MERIEDIKQEMSKSLKNVRDELGDALRAIDNIEELL